MQTWYEWIGWILLLATTLHMVLALFSSWRRMLQENHRHDLESKLLQQKVALLKEQLLTQQEHRTLSWTGTRPFILQKKQAESSTVSSFFLTLKDNQPLPPFKPGCYLTFSIQPPNHERTFIRCYSLSSSARERDYYRISIKHIESQTGPPPKPEGIISTYFHHQLQVGASVDAKSPSGDFFLEVEENTPLVLIGGGIGVTPVLSMLKTLIDHDSQREIWFFYGVANAENYPFQKELEQIKQQHTNLQIHLCFSRTPPTSESPIPTHKGRITLDFLKNILPSNQFDYYLCGPMALMNDLTEGLSQWGVLKEKIHFESFGPSSKPSAKKDENQTNPITVHFTQSNKKLQWQGGEQTLLELAEQNGIILESGCGAGGCGSCQTSIKSGEVMYNDEPSYPVDPGSCLVCVSHPKTDLVLDA